MKRLLLVLVAMAICGFANANPWYMYEVLEATDKVVSDSWEASTNVACGFTIKYPDGVSSNVYRVFLVNKVPWAAVPQVTKDAAKQAAQDHRTDYDKWDNEVIAVIEGLYDEINEIRTNLLQHPVGPKTKADKKKKIKAKYKP